MLKISKSAIVSLIAALAIVLDCGHAAAQTSQGDSKSDDEQALVERWYKAYDEIIDSIQVSCSTGNVPTGSANSSIMKRQTILTLNNPQWEGRHGKVYLWTDEGRPITLGVIMSANVKTVPGQRSVAYEFNSLAQGNVVGSRFDEVFWKCDKPGVEWKQGLTDVVPSETRATRLTQMKAYSSWGNR